MRRDARMNRWLAGSLATGAAVTIGALAVGPALYGGSSESVAQSRAGLDRQFAKLPLRFEPNQGQAAKQVDFLARGPGYTMALARGGAVLALSSGKGSGATGASSSVVGMHIVGGNRGPRASGARKLPGVSNYMLGADRSRWRTGVPTYAQVRYDGVLPGVDMVYRGNQKELEYDLHVAPGTDPATIALAFKGSKKLSITDGGDLLIHARNGAIRQRRPVVYQGEGAAKRIVSGRYLLKAKGRHVGFAIGSYDRSKELVIDPSIAYSTHLGGHNMLVANGSAGDQAAGIAVDAAGNAYVVGQTDAIPVTTPASAGSSAYPTTAGAVQATFGGGTRDAFITKLNAAGDAILYSTYLGGSLEDRATDVAVASNGNAYVSGTTVSTNFPTRAPLQASNGGGARDAFVAQLNDTGTALVYATYLGGRARTSPTASTSTRTAPPTSRATPGPRTARRPARR